MKRVNLHGVGTPSLMIVQLYIFEMFPQLTFRLGKQSNPEMVEAIPPVGSPTVCRRSHSDQFRTECAKQIC